MCLYNCHVHISIHMYLDIAGIIFIIAINICSPVLKYVTNTQKIGKFYWNKLITIHIFLPDSQFHCVSLNWYTPYTQVTGIDHILLLKSN